MIGMSLSIQVVHIRRHGSDVYLGMYPIKHGRSYLNVLARFGRSSETAVERKN